MHVSLDDIFKRPEVSMSKLQGGIFRCLENM